MTERRFDPGAAVATLAADPSGLSREELRVFLRTAAQTKAWVEGREFAGIRALDSLPDDPSSPAKDTAGEVGRDQNLGPGQAKRKTETAQQLGSLPATQDALGRGEISGEHAEAIARARARADASARAALDREEARLLEEGRNETAWQFGKRLERFVKRHSADDGRSNWERMKDREEVSLVPNGDGMYRLSGLLHPEPTCTTSRVLRGICDELYRRDHPGVDGVPADALSNKKRMAEALHEMARRAEGKPHPAGNHDRVVTILQYEDLLARLGDDAHLPDGTPVPAGVARRLACRAGILPLVLDGDSVPLDLGRSKRFVTPGQRTALGAQWATCSVADCTVPFEWTEIHHVDPFETGGRTDLGRLTPACTHCHDLAHTPGWTVDKLPDGTVVTTAPDGTEWRRRPNRQPGPPTAAPAAQPDPRPAADTLFSHAA